MTLLPVHHKNHKANIKRQLREEIKLYRDSKISTSRRDNALSFNGYINELNQHLPRIIQGITASFGGRKDGARGYLHRKARGRPARGGRYYNTSCTEPGLATLR